LGYGILIAGMATAVIDLVALERARALIASWSQLGSGVVRLTGLGVLALGSVIAYACAPPRRAP
jgi:uncharacterized protein YjeT (DUF2065 family)